MSARRKARPLLINDPAGYMSFDPPITVETLRQQVASFEGTPVGAIFWCVGDRELYYYESKVGELYTEVEKGLERPPGGSLGWDTADVIAANQRQLTAEAGGPLTALVGLCREAGIDIFPSVRMNSHYKNGEARGDPSSPTYGRFRREHPELLIEHPGEVFPEDSVMFGIRTGLDYAHPEVREHYADVMTDLLERFDVDGLELDFFRHPAFFRPEEAYANRHLMTDLVRHARQKMSDVGTDRGRTLELAVRVPESLSDSARIGLDVAEWMSQGLVDIVVVGSGMIPFEAAIEEFLEAAQGTGIEVYGCIEGLRPTTDEYSRHVRDGLEMENGVLRAIASRFWQAGASGIYLFNVDSEPKEWKHLALNEIGGPAALEGLDKRFQMDRDDRNRLPSQSYHVYAFRYAVPPVQLPVTLAQTISGRTAVLRVRVDEDMEHGLRARSVLRLGLENYQPEDAVEVRLNRELLPQDSMKESYGAWGDLEWQWYANRADEHATGGVVECDVENPPLRQGENEVGVRLIRHTPSVADPVIVRYVEVDIRHSQA